MNMKKFKLIVHQQNFSEEELVINPRDYNGLQIGDVVEIYHPEDTFSRLLLQVNKLSTDFQQKDTISIEQSVASTFQLRPYLDVYVNRLEPVNVTLDMVEIVFKDQYLSRSDLWRLQRSLIDSCVYMGKKLIFSGLRLQVHELWVNGEKLACGVVGRDTKVVFRSQSAQIHIFIQMSAEMWEFDFFGDLYFEKTVNGFMSELFEKWRANNCNHEVTIVLFSRVFYNSKNYDEFPKEMQSSVSKRIDGKFYQDFYKVIINAEQVDDWKSIAMKLKTNFNNYLSWIGCDEGSPKNQPQGTNSRAMDGNVLEAVNISLNVFETFFIDVNLERTNATAMVVTPGCGVFDVERELTGMTKQRLMDGGFGVDLVCLAEQPLHAVPLLKFISKKQQRFKEQNIITIDYNIPQWINHSFYRSPEQRNSSSRFIPRMKVPERPSIIEDGDESSDDIRERPDQFFAHSEIDFDDYDAQVFTYATPRTMLRSRLSRNVQKKRKGDLGVTRKSSPDMHSARKPELKTQQSWSDSRNASPGPPVRALSECEDTRLGTSFGENMIFIEDDTVGESDSGSDIDVVLKRNLVGGGSNIDAHPTYQAGFVNPFKPYHLSYKLTLFRHLWLHTFPTDPSGEAMQEHHRKVLMDQDGISPSVFDAEDSTVSILDGVKSSEHLEHQESLRFAMDKRPGDPFDSNEFQKVKSIKKVGSDKSLYSGSSGNWLFPKPQDQDWTTAILTGVDWKSLSIPACLPLTTDYFPDQKTFENDFFWYNYNLIIDDSYYGPTSDETCRDRFKMTAKDKFLEAVAQRIAQGFQFVKNRDRLKFLLSPNKGGPSVFQKLNTRQDEEFVLSHVQQIHFIQFDGMELSVNKYVAKHIPTTKPIDYKYKLWPTNSGEFQGACTVFSHDDTVNYNWNYLDHYVTGEGDDCNMLLEDMKYWRLRFILLPRRDRPTEETKYSGDTKMIEIEGFLKFIEGLNAIKRPINQRMLFICRKHTAEDQITYMERRQGLPDDNKKKGEKNEPESNPKRGTPNGAQKKGTPVKESPSDNREKKSKRNQSISSEDFVDDQKNAPVDQKSSNSEETAEKDHPIPSKLPPEHGLESTSPLEDVVKAMQNTEYGLSFLPEQAGLRQWTFISAEAVAWMIKSVDGIDEKQDAVELCQRMLDAKLIMHASQTEAQCFVDGMYLFFVKSPEKVEEKAEKGRKISWKMKKTEEELLMSYNIKWFEVEVWRGKPPDKLPEYLKESVIPESPVKSPRSPSKEKKQRAASVTPPGKPAYKSMDYCLDSNRRSDRAEWCTIYYNDNYCTDQSFSLELHWMVSTASIIYERVQQWARRAITCGFHLVPAPVHPLPIHCNYDEFASKKNPLNKPNFIPLNIECLLSSGQKHIFEALICDCLLIVDTTFFQEFDKSSWNRRMILFQEAILLRFGFLRDFPRASSTYGFSFNKKREAHSNQYVHWTGGVFVRIVEQPIEFKPHSSPSIRKINFEEKAEDELSSYKSSSKRVQLQVDTLLNDLGTTDLDEDKFPAGFFWTHNYCLTKKWRSNYTGDENAASKLMTDFGDFCANGDGLLGEFWKNALTNSKQPDKEDSEEQMQTDEDR